MSDLEERSTLIVQHEEQKEEIFPVNPFKNEIIFHSKEMGDYFITQLQQHETAASELDNYKAHTSAQIESIQSTIDRLTTLLE